VLAYTLPSANVFAYCASFFNQLTPLTRQCYGQDQATTVLHESTHAPAVYSPGTVDNAYGYSASVRLNSAQSVANADSYALYAGGKLSCSVLFDWIEMKGFTDSFLLAIYNNC
jgi:deuterolysin